MDKDEALQLVRDGNASVWNHYRENSPDWCPDLSGEDLEDSNLSQFDLTSANLRSTDLSQATLSETYGYAGATLRRTTTLKGARIDIKTKFPADFDAIREGAVYGSQADARHDDRSRARVFISYAWANDEVVLAIDEWLRNKGLRTKLDKRDFFAGSRIRDEIMRVMQDCEVILIFHSRQSVEKPWPEFEREFAIDLAMTAKQQGREPPRIIYVVIDDAPLPNISEANRLAIIAKGKRFELVCEEIYHSILQLPHRGDPVDLDKWGDFVF